MSSLDFDEYPITEKEVISILGTDYRVQGQELVFQCRACPGGDTHKDNLKYNKQKHVLKCHAGCGFESELCAIIARRRMSKIENGENQSEQEYTFDRKEPEFTPVKVEREKEIPQHELSDYYFLCNQNLMSNKDLLRKLYLRHSVMPLTACECNIGYDPKKNMFVFPSRATGKDPTDNLLIVDNGAEYREIEGEKTVRRISGYDPAICAVHCGAFVMFGIICEGYKDAYNLVQLFKMTEPELMNCTAIFTVQNGTNSINTNNCLQKVNWNRFERIGLLMDNDKAGDTAIAVAQEFFPNMEDLREKYIFGYNDIEQRFRTEFGDKIDIERALQATWLNEYEGV